jgi:hypothetical protein
MLPPKSLRSQIRQFLRRSPLARPKQSHSYTWLQLANIESLPNALVADPQSAAGRRLRIIFPRAPAAAALAVNFQSSGSTRPQRRSRNQPVRGMKLSRRQGQLTRGDRVHRSGRGVVSGFRLGMCEGAWQALPALGALVQPAIAKKVPWPRSQSAVAGVGDVVLRVEGRESMPNVFGRADIFGRTRTTGFTTTQYGGMQGKNVVLLRSGVTTQFRCHDYEQHRGLGEHAAWRQSIFRPQDQLRPACHSRQYPLWWTGRQILLCLLLARPSSLRLLHLRL